MNSDERDLRLRSGMRDPLLLILAFGAAVALATLLPPHFSYNRWDNFEYFTPTLLDAHGRWLHGQLPLWTSRQDLGEPLLANAQAGVFYPVYTVAVAIVELLNRPGWLMAVVAAIHFSVGLVGWLFLLERLGLRRWLAGVTAFSIEGGGFVALIVPLWTFMGGVLCWMPWALYGTVRALRDPDDPHALWVPAALALLAAIGHPQMLVYAWLWLLVTGGLIGWAERAPARAWKRWAGLLMAGALLSAPTIVPAYLESRLSTRAAAFSYARYVSRSVTPSDLGSLLLPVLRSVHGYLATVGSLSFYQGAWVAPALCCGALGVAARTVPSRVASLRRTGRTASPDLLFVSMLVAAVPFVLLALGRWGGLARLLYGIPVWSSFRWPFKFLLFAGASITLAAGLGVEVWLRRISNVGRKAGLRLGLVLTTVLLVAVANSIGWIGRHPVYSAAFGVLFALSALALIMADRTWGAGLLIACSWGGVLLVQAFAQVSDLKRYDEAVGAYGPSVLGIDPSDRVLPVQSYPRPSGMQAMALYQAGSFNGYDVATGSTTGMAPSWFVSALPSDGAGLLPDSSYETLLGSRFLKTLDVRYALVRNTDRKAIAWMERRDFRLVRRLPATSVYAQEGVLSRVYFAEEARPYSPEQLREGLIENRAPVRTVYLEGVKGRMELPRARVLSVDREANGTRAEVDAPEGGLVVFSSTYYPQWRAYADGKQVPTFRVNGVVTGARIPPGTTTVRFEFGFAGLGLSVFLFALGAMVLGLLFVTRRVPGKVPAVEPAPRPSP